MREIKERGRKKRWRRKEGEGMTAELRRGRGRGKERVTGRLSVPVKGEKE